MTFIDSSTIRTIAHMTDNNDHIGAIRVACDALDATGWAAQVADLEALVSKIGHVPDSLNQFASELRNQMYALAKRELDADDFTALHDAF